MPPGALPGRPVRWKLISAQWLLLVDSRSTEGSVECAAPGAIELVTLSAGALGSGCAGECGGQPGGLDDHECAPDEEHEPGGGQGARTGWCGLFDHHEACE